MSLDGECYVCKKPYTKLENTTEYALNTGLCPGGCDRLNHLSSVLGFSLTRTARLK